MYGMSLKANLGSGNQCRFQLCNLYTENILRSENVSMLKKLEKYEELNDIICFD